MLDKSLRMQMICMHLLNKPPTKSPITTFNLLLSSMKFLQLLTYRTEI
jgi:hypothetical protein